MEGFNCVWSRHSQACRNFFNITRKGFDLWVSFSALEKRTELEVKASRMTGDNLFFVLLLSTNQIAGFLNLTIRWDVITRLFDL